MANIIVGITYKQIHDLVKPYLLEQNNSSPSFLSNLFSKRIRQPKADKCIQKVILFYEKTLKNNALEERIAPGELHRLYFIFREYELESSSAAHSKIFFASLMTRFTDVSSQFIQILHRLYDIGLISNQSEIEEEDFVLVASHDLDVLPKESHVNMGRQIFEKIVTHQEAKELLYAISELLDFNDQAEWSTEIFNGIFIRLIDYSNIKAFNQFLSLDNRDKLLKSDCWLTQLNQLTPPSRQEAHVSDSESKESVDSAGSTWNGIGRADVPNSQIVRKEQQDVASDSEIQNALHEVLVVEPHEEKVEQPEKTDLRPKHQPLFGTANGIHNQQYIQGLYAPIKSMPKQEYESDDITKPNFFFPKNNKMPPPLKGFNPYMPLFQFNQAHLFMLLRQNQNKKPSTLPTKSPTPPNSPREESPSESPRSVAGV